MKTVPLRIAVVLLAALAFLPGAAASLAESSPTPASSAPWTWPPAPDTPRIQHIKTFITPEDLDIKKGFFSKLWDFVAGKDTLDRIVSPHGITANGEGKVYVADWGGACVHFFDFKRKKYDRFNQTGDGVLLSPIGIAVDAEGLVYVSDSARRKVYVFDGAKNKRTIGEGLLRPTGIAINKREGILYVVDTLGHRVHRFDLTGRKIGSFGTQGAGDGQFNYPTHIALGPSGDVYVMDSLNFRVQIFDRTGAYVSKFGGMGTGIHDFMKPKGIAVDSDGQVWVSDSMRNSIQVFDRQGRLLMIFGRIGIGRGEFNIPAGIFMDAQNRLYVADSYNYRVQAFQYLKQ